MQFKKLAAITGSALMASLALAGPALATSVTALKDIGKLVSVTDSTVSYPLFVIGATAATADVAGAVGIAVNLASNAKTTSVVTVAGAGETVTGGAKIATTGIYLTPWYNPQNVKGIMTASDIPTLLSSGTYSTAAGGSYQYKQYLYMLGDTTNSNPAQIKHERPTTENSPRLAFKTPASSKLYRFKLTFSTPISLSSVTDDTTLKAVIQGTTLNFLGKDFVISDAARTSDADTISSLTLLGGKNVITVETGTPKTVTVDTKDYTVTLTGVAVQTVGTTTYYTAIGDVSGESYTLKAGETKTMADGTLIAAIKVFQGKTGAADYATIAIGAEKITLTSAGTVTKGTTVNAELTAGITATKAAGWSVLTIDYTPSIDAWLAAGSKITDPFASAFDIKFNSVTPDFTDTANRQTITLSPSGYNLLLTHKNAAGNEKQMYSLYTIDGSTWRWAAAGAGLPTYYDNNWRDVVFDEGLNISAVEQDYFVIQRGGFSHTMQFTTYTNATKTYTFTDEAGNTLTATGSTGVAQDTADLIVDGNTYKVYLVDDTKKIVNIDLTGDGTIAGFPSASYSTLSTTPGTYTGKEYSFLVPKLITTGQGGLYFYNGMSTTFRNSTTTAQYPKIGLVGVNVTLGATTGTLRVGGTLIGTGTQFSPGAISNVTGTADSGYIDFVVNCSASGAIWNCSCGIGTSATGILTDPGFVLVEEAQQGGTAHNWLYLPVKWDSTNSRTYINTVLYSDDTNYVDVAILGTATQYKGMTTYGTLADHLSTTLGGSATISYPDTFTYANVYVLGPGATISATGTAGQVTTEKVLPITADVVKLDSEITSTDKSTYDIVLVGGPCVNTLVAELATAGKFPYTCAAWPGRDFGRVQLISDAFATGKTALVIAGTRAADTDLAARIVQTGFPGATDTQKAGTYTEVTGTVTSPAYA